MAKVKVWDWPTRLFHWLLVAAIIFQYVSGEILDDAMQWHFYSGYFCLGLILFRVLWGLLGSYYARFSQFMVSPQKAMSYLTSSRSQSYLGHNPAGAYSIVLLMSLVATQAISGLFMSDEVFLEGPYYQAVSESGKDIANFLHHNVFNVLLAAIALHLLAIIYYKIKYKQSLAKAMITGYKQSEFVNNETTKKVQVSFSWLKLLICLFISILGVYLLVEVLPPAPVDEFFIY